MYILIQCLSSFSFKGANSYFIVKCNMHNGIYCLSIISFSRLILTEVWQTIWQASCNLPGDDAPLEKWWSLRSLCWCCDVWLEVVFRLWCVTWGHCVEVMMFDLRSLCWGRDVWPEVIVLRSWCLTWGRCVEVTFSAHTEQLVPFTRDYETIKAAIFAADDHNKTCIETALRSLSPLAREEWGINAACQVGQSLNSPLDETREMFNRLALKSGIDSHQESPQVGHSQPANTAQCLNSVYVVASSD